MNLESEFFFSDTYYFPCLGKGAPSVKRLFGKKFSPLRGETWQACSPPRVVSHGTIGSPLRPPNLGEFGGKPKTLTPNISSPEGGRGVLPVPYDAPRWPLLKFQTPAGWAPPWIFGGFFPKFRIFFRGQKFKACSSVPRTFWAFLFCMAICWEYWVILSE